MRAINTICRAGGLRAAVAQGVLTSGVMYECIRDDVDYVLAGSIRDDGPLPDTIMDLVDAQDRYSAALQGVSLVLVLSTMLHGIGVGNMLPAWVALVCVDINPGGGHQTRRSRLVADDGAGYRRRAVSAAAFGSVDVDKRQKTRDKRPDTKTEDQRPKTRDMTRAIACRT